MDVAWTEEIARDVYPVWSAVVVLLGVILFGWSASALLVVYWVEAGIAIVRGTVQGLFAERTPGDLSIDHRLPLSSWGEKRGGVSLWVLPPIYPRNVPIVIAGIIVLVLFWPIAGGMVLVGLEPGIPAGSVLVAVVSLFVGHGVRFVDYITRGRYTDASVRSVLLRRETVSVFVLGVGGLIVYRYASPPSSLLIAVVVVKLVGDIVFARVEPGGSLTEWDDDPVESDVPDGDPIESFRVSRWSLLARAVGYTPLYLLVPPYLFLVCAAGLAGLIGGLGVGVAAGVGAVGVTALGQLVRTAVETAHLEYHVYPSRIVAHDRLLDTPQWTINRPTVTAVAIEPSWVDRIRPGNRTVVVSVYDQENRFRALRRPEAFVASIQGVRTSSGNRSR